MADNSVFITGVADGAFETALGDLPPWATEDTALSIEAILRKTLNVQTKAFSELVKKASDKSGTLDPKKLNGELDQLVKNFHEQNAQAEKDKKRNKETEDENKREKKRRKENGEVFSKRMILDAAIIKAGYAIKDVFENNVRTFNNLTASGINVLSSMDGVTDGFDSIRNLSVLTGVRFTELAASMQKYSSAVNSFGMGNFAKTVGKASKELTQFGFSSKESADLLGAYLTTQQNVSDVSKKTSNEVAADLKRFGNSVFRLSIATGVSRTAIIANAEAISRSTDANLLAGQIGKESASSMTAFLASFKDQNVARQILKLMSDPIKPLNESFMNLQKVGMGGFAQSFTQFTKSIEGMPEDVKQQALKSFIGANRAELEQKKQHLALLKQAGVAEAGAALDLVVGLTQQADAVKPLKEEEVKRLQASNAASKDLANAWEKLMSTFQRMFAPTAGMLNMFTGALNAVMVPLDLIAKALDWLSNTLTSFADKLGFAGQKIDVAPWIGLAAIGYALYKSLSLFGVGLKTIGSMMKTTMFGGGKKGLADAAAGGGSRAAGKAGGGLAGLGKGVGSGVGGALGGLAEGLKKLGDPKVLLGVAALAGIAAALWITGKAIQQFVSIKWEDLAKAGVALVGITVGILALGAIMSSGVGAVAILAGAAAMVIMAGALWVLGKAIDAIGVGFEALSKGIGQLNNTDFSKITTITKSLMILGAGLAMAAPMLILGASGLYAISKAAAASTGLQNLAANIKLFEQLNGQNLINVAKGIIGLTSALGVFTAGSVIGSVGNVLSSIGGGLAKLFGSGSVLDQLKTFAAMGPGLQKSSSSITSMSGDLATLSKVLGAFTGLDTLKSIVQTVNGIEVVKALAFGAMSKVGNVSLPPPRPTTGVSVPTSPKASTLNSPSAVSTNAKTGGDQSTVKETQTSSGSGIETPVGDSSINTSLNHQSALLAQLLTSTNTLISVNKDILKYTRANA